jgi:hypothetical protein
MWCVLGERISGYCFVSPYCVVVVVCLVFAGGGGGVVGFLCYLSWFIMVLKIGL